ncbi:MAG: integrin alpha [Myxococcota bacterium]|nr:integrin alpha [Myxococcota bacterium]
MSAVGLLIFGGTTACTDPKSDTGDSVSIDPIETGDSAGGDSDPVETAEDSHSGDSVETDVPGTDVDGDGYLSEDDGGTDCDDGNPAVHPDAVERLANGLDDDCDGLLDTLDAEDASAMFVDLEIGGGAGLAVAGVGDMNGTGVGVYAIGAPFSEGVGEAGGRVYLFSGQRTGFVELTEADAVLLGATESEAGKALAGGGDVNADGYADLLVGGYHGAEGAGITWVVHGPILGEQVLDNVGVSLVGQSAYDFSACAVDFAGDVDGDGDDEVLVGAYHATTTTHGSYDGAAYLVDPPLSGTLSLDNAIRIVGETPGDEAGYALAGPGDLDGDGLSDVVVGARYESSAGEYAGAVYVFLSPLDVAVNASDADARYLGEVSGGYAGSALSGAGDVDGDGHVDFVVGSRRYDGVGDSSGAAHLLRGPALSGGSLLDADARLLGEAAGDRAGWAVSGAGDFNGDGLDDLLVGAPRHSSAGRLGGGAYLVLGPVAPVLELSDSDGKVVSGADEMLLGVSVAGVGDVDGDQRGDLLIGAERGEVFLVTTGLP